MPDPKESAINGGSIPQGKRVEIIGKDIYEIRTHPGTDVGGGVSPDEEVDVWRETRENRRPIIIGKQ